MNKKTLQKQIVEQVSKSRIKKFFETLEDIPLTSDIEDLEDAYWGGLANFGDPRAAQVITRAPGYREYEKYLHETAKKILGREFTAYRLMSRDSYEDLLDGVGIGNISATLQKSFAKKFVNFAGFTGDKSKLIPVEFKVPYDALVMRGKDSEYEIVINSGWIDGSTLNIVP